MVIRLAGPLAGRVQRHDNNDNTKLSTINAWTSFPQNHLLAATLAERGPPRHTSQFNAALEPWTSHSPSLQEAQPR